MCSCQEPWVESCGKDSTGEVQRDLNEESRVESKPNTESMKEGELRSSGPQKGCDDKSCVFLWGYFLHFSGSN